MVDSGMPLRHVSAYSAVSSSDHVSLVADEDAGAVRSSIATLQIPVWRGCRYPRVFGALFVLAAFIVVAGVGRRPRYQEMLQTGNLSREHMERAFDACHSGFLSSRIKCALLRKHQEHHELTWGDEKCHTVQKGDPCYAEVHHAMHQHITDHLDVYEGMVYQGLTAHSSFEEFQDYIRYQKQGDGTNSCPVPCGLKEAKAKTRAALGFDKECHDTVDGEPCSSHVVHALRQIPKHPENFQGLSHDSTQKEIQYFLSNKRDDQGNAVCPRPCNYNSVSATEVLDEVMPKIQESVPQSHQEEAGCNDAVQADPCFIHVRETMMLLDMYPDNYPELSTYATFKEVQRYLHDKHGAEVCPAPCVLDARTKNETTASTRTEATTVES